MSPPFRSPDRGPVLLSRMESACNQTGRHLDLVYRQIELRAERMTTTQKAKASNRSHGRSGPRWTRLDEALFRSNLERLDFERRTEIEALIRKLSRQEAAISDFRGRQHAHPRHERTAA